MGDIEMFYKEKNKKSYKIYLGRFGTRTEACQFGEIMGTAALLAVFIMGLINHRTEAIAVGLLFLECPLIELILYFYAKRIARQVEADVAKSMEIKENEQEKIYQEKQRQILQMYKSYEHEMFCNDIDGILAELKNNDIALNRGSMWYLEQRMNIREILLASKDASKHSDCVTETLLARKQGLPVGYYVIGRKDGYYLCCQKETERIYSFSSYLGVTNTQYADIYDYVIEWLSARECE